MRQQRGDRHSVGLSCAVCSAAFPVSAKDGESGGRVKGGEAAERSEGTLDALEHSHSLTRRGMRSFSWRTCTVPFWC